MIKRIVNKVLGPLKRKKNERLVAEAVSRCNIFSPLDCGTACELKESVGLFLYSRSLKDKKFHYVYSKSSTKATLYASAYACMTSSLIGDLDRLSSQDRKEWVAYFDSFQSEDDGLFYDMELDGHLFRNADWWGARHLALHMISAYTDLHARPKYEFKFLREYYDTSFLKKWLDEVDWDVDVFSYESDVDNKIMNIACLLQYQRDKFDDADASQAISYIKKYLRTKINPDTGFWGDRTARNSKDISRMVQFFYHLLQIYAYDGDFDFMHSDVVDYVLKTQNRYGGYGVQPNSSACEDIDSIDILIRFYPFVSEATRAQIELSLQMAHRWVLVNHVADGGFVFRLNDPMVYGDRSLLAKANEGAMLPTWFRTLSLAYLSFFFDDDGGFVITRCPGYEF